MKNRSLSLKEALRALAEEKERSGLLLRRIEADLEQAARIQKALLPKASPSLEGFDIFGLNVPCYEIGGDYFDFVPIDADWIGLVIADVSGKGISASLLMASLRAALLAEVYPEYDLRRMAARLNDCPLSGLHSCLRAGSDPRARAYFFLAVHSISRSIMDIVPFMFAPSTVPLYSMTISPWGP